MLYSPYHRFLFVHIPKTGGTSIRAALKPVLYRDPWYLLMWAPQRLSHFTGHRTVTKFPRHAKVVAAVEMLPPEIYSKLFKFSVVRNPWDMQVSSFHHLHKEHPDAVQGLHEFKEFVRYKLSRDRVPNSFLDISGTPQMRYLTDIEGRMQMDTLIRFETLTEDFERIVKRVGIKPPPALPHRRKGKRQSDYRSYYDDETAQIVADWYADDIREFGYTFDF